MARNRLAARRRMFGLSQEGLAEALGVATSTVARWEQGSATPRPWYRPLLAGVLEVSLARLDRLLADESADGSVDQPDERSNADITDIDRLRQQLRRLDSSYDSTPSALLVGPAGQCLGHITMLRRHAVGAVAHDLCAAEAAAATLVGQLVWDASQRREHAAARRYFEQATIAAQAIGDAAAEGLALLRSSFVALYGEGNPQTGRDLAAHAADVSRPVSAVIVGLALLHVAEAHAMMRERGDCERALGEAEALLARIEESDPGRGLFSPTQPGRLAGSCYLFLGDHKRAQQILEDTASTFGGVSKNQAIVWGNLGLARIRQQHVDSAADALHRAIDVVEETRGGGGLNIVFDAGRELRPWRDLPIVRDVHDRLLTLMTAA